MFAGSALQFGNFFFYIFPIITIQIIMQTTLINDTASGLLWIDFTAPTREELEHLAKQYNLHQTSVEDCLQPDHLPKLEVIGNTTFLMLRRFDSNARNNADTLQGLTTKVAIFTSNQLLVTVHRLPLSQLSQIAEHWKDFNCSLSDKLSLIVKDISKAILDTYEKEIDSLDLKIDEAEKKLILGSNHQDSSKMLYYTKRKSIIFRRVLLVSYEIFSRQSTNDPNVLPYLNDIQEKAYRLQIEAEEQVEQINNLLNLQMAFAAQRTSDIMRVLTVFSLFFLPLTFIVGVYGMNFEYMPEIEWRYGYAFAMGLCVIIVLAIYLYFRRNKWL